MRISQDVATVYLLVVKGHGWINAYEFETAVEAEEYQKSFPAKNGYRSVITNVTFEGETDASV